jgi:HEAT repeat protein
MEPRQTWKDGMTFEGFRRLVRHVLDLIRRSQPPARPPKPDAPRAALLWWLVPVAIIAASVAAALWMAARYGCPPQVSVRSPVSIPVDRIPQNLDWWTTEVIKDLYSDDPAVRAHAAWQLGYWQRDVDEAVVPFLVEMLGDVPHEVSERDGIPARDWDSAAGRPGLAAQQALACMGEAAVGPLIEALETSDKPWVRRRAILALAEMDGEGVAARLTAAISDSDTFIRKAAVVALGMRGTPPFAKSLPRMAFGDSDAGVRDAALDAMKRAPGGPAPALAEMLGEPEVEVRLWAVHVLGQLKEPAALPHLAKALGDEDAGVRRAAVGALCWLGDPQAVDPLVGALGDADAGVRRAAAGGLGYFGDRRAVGPLIEALGDRDAAVREAAATALESITEQDFGQDAEGWRTWWAKNVPGEPGG